MNIEENNKLIAQILGPNYALSPNAFFLYNDNAIRRMWTIELIHTKADGSTEELKFAHESDWNTIKDIPDDTQFATVLTIIKDNIDGAENPTQGFFS